jgi:glutathione synthase/RimK-type ligase-like ATP-grasp enzyme
MILLWGLPGDDPLALVHRALVRLGQRVFFFDQRDVLDAELEVRFCPDLSGRLRVKNEIVDLEDVKAVYFRLYLTSQLPKLRTLDPNDPAYAHADAITAALTEWFELTPSLVVNRSSTMESNSSKPFQLRLIEQHGFRVPDTIVTTDPDCALAFWRRHGEVIFKSVSGLRSIVTKLAPGDEERLPLVRWCPTQFQEFIPGKDYRLHVVGDELFASEVVSSATDYRYARRFGATADVEPWVLPIDVADRCRALAHALGLEVAGVDLRQHTNGDWHCFEVNPSPAYSFYQYATRQPIDLAIAQLLASGRSFAARSGHERDLSSVLRTSARSKSG